MGVTWVRVPLAWDHLGAGSAGVYQISKEVYDLKGEIISLYYNVDVRDSDLCIRCGQVGRLLLWFHLPVVPYGGVCRVGEWPAPWVELVPADP